MRHICLILASSAIGMASAAELQRNRFMRSVDHFPGWRYGPGGQSGIFESEDDVPKGWKDHPSLVGEKADPESGVKTAKVPANTTTTEAKAAKSIEAKSQTQVDPSVAATSGVGGAGSVPAGNSPATPSKGVELDADGHPYDPALHAGTGSKTKDGKWRMKVGVKRPDPAPGYPLDL